MENKSIKIAVITAKELYAILDNTNNADNDLKNKLKEFIIKEDN